MVGGSKHPAQGKPPLRPPTRNLVSGKAAGDGRQQPGSARDSISSDGDDQPIPVRPIPRRPGDAPRTSPQRAGARQLVSTPPSSASSQPRPASRLASDSASQNGFRPSSRTQSRPPSRHGPPSQGGASSLSPSRKRPASAQPRESDPFLPPTPLLPTISSSDSSASMEDDVMGLPPPGAGGLALSGDGRDGLAMLSPLSLSGEPGGGLADYGSDCGSVAPAVRGADDDASRSSGGNIRVCLRVRPLNEREKRRGDDKVTVPINPRVIEVTSNAAGGQGSKVTRQFNYDLCCHEGFNQDDLFSHCGVQNLLHYSLSGYACTTFAYGQTGSGKTYTMEGLISRSIHFLYQAMDDGARSHGVKYKVRISFSEIYNEQVFDLLNLEAGPLAVRYHAKKGFYVQGIFEVECDGVEDVLSVLEEGQAQRRKAPHEMNQDSSRSHSLFTLQLISMGVDQDLGTPFNRFGKMVFVDLAGSERLKATRSANSGETGKINVSLFTLGKVIAALSLPKNNADTVEWAPYRDSTLTKLLMDSLGGDSYTLMIACVSPSSVSVEETISTLHFAARARKIKNKPVVQMDPHERLVQNLKRELKLLRMENDFLRKMNREHVGIVPAMNTGLLLTADSSPGPSSRASTRPATGEGREQKPRRPSLPYGGARPPSDASGLVSRRGVAPWDRNRTPSRKGSNPYWSPPGRRTTTPAVDDPTSVVALFTEEMERLQQELASMQTEKSEGAKRFARVLEENEKLQRGVEELLKLKEEPRSNTDTTGSLLQENLKLKEQLSKLQEGLAIAANPVRRGTVVNGKAVLKGDTLDASTDADDEQDDDSLQLLSMALRRSNQQLQKRLQRLEQREMELLVALNSGQVTIPMPTAVTPPPDGSSRPPTVTGKRSPPRTPKAEAAPTPPAQVQVQVQVQVQPDQNKARSTAVEPEAAEPKASAPLRPEEPKEPKAPLHTPPKTQKMTAKAASPTRPATQKDAEPAQREHTTGAIKQPEQEPPQVQPWESPRVDTKTRVRSPPSRSPKQSKPSSPANQEKMAATLTRPKPWSPANQEKLPPKLTKPKPVAADITANVRDLRVTQELIAQAEATPAVNKKPVSKAIEVKEAEVDGTSPPEAVAKGRPTRQRAATSLSPKVRKVEEARGALLTQEPESTSATKAEETAAGGGSKGKADVRKPPARKSLLKAPALSVVTQAAAGKPTQASHPVELA